MIRKICKDPGKDVCCNENPTTFTLNCDVSLCIRCIRYFISQSSEKRPGEIYKSKQ